MAGILFVAPSRDAQRAVFSEQGRGLWSAALPAVLEKHGYLAIESAEQDALADIDRLAGYDVVLVAQGPDDPWVDGRLGVVRERGVGLLLDGPPTPSARAELGIAGVEEITEPGTVQVRDRSLRVAAERFGTPTAGRIAMPLERSTGQRAGPQSGSAPELPITSEQAAAWNAQPWDAEAWSHAAGGRVLMDWVGADTSQRSAAVVQWNNVVACSFGLFAFLAYAHSIGPIPAGQSQAASRSIGVEAALLGIIDLLHQQRNAVRLRVRPWPRGTRWVVSVRHDIERGGAGSVRAAVKEDPDLATWACAPRGGADAAKAAAQAGHEVALLARDPWRAEGGSELSELEHELSGVSVRGAVASHALGAFGFRGAPNVTWAARERLLYTELLGRGHLHPHRFPALAADGAIQILEPVCVPWYENLAALVSDPERIERAVALWSAAAGLLQLRVGPDAAEQRWLPRVRDFELRGASRWTIADAATWWRRSHDLTRIGVRALGGGRFALRAREPVDGLVTELLHPDGSVSEHAIDVGQDECVVESATSKRALPVTWDATWQSYERALASAGVAREELGLPASAQSASARAASVAAAAELPLGLLREFGASIELSRSVVLDLGAGFGARACYLAWRAAPEAIVAVDDRPWRLRAAAEATATLGFDRRVRFVLSSSSELRELPDESIDVAIVSDAPLLSHGRRTRTAMLSELHRVLVPSGLAVIHCSRGRRGLAVALLHGLRRAGLHESQVIRHERPHRRLAGPRTYVTRRFTIVSQRPGMRGRRMDLPAQRPIAGGRPAGIEFLEQVPAVFAHHVRLDLRARGVNGSAAARAVRINSTLAERRAQQLLQLMRDALGILTLVDRTVLECGCGFGAVTAQLALQAAPASMIAVDADPRNVAVARTCIEELGLETVVDVRNLDAEALDGVASGSVDVAIANGVPSGDGDRALAELRRVLAPGGALLLIDTRWALASPALRRRLARAGLAPITTKFVVRREALDRELPRSAALAARKPA